MGHSKNEINVRKRTAEATTGEMTFPTAQRPMRVTRRPSRENRSFSRSRNTLFGNGEEHSSQESISQENIPDLVALIKGAISKANLSYQLHTTEGLNERTDPGWWSWLRHGEDGKKHAEEFNNELQLLDSIESIISKLNTFFRKQDTRYHYNSFASYALDELNTILENLHYQSFRPESTEHYQIKSWSCVAIELHKIRLGIAPKAEAAAASATI